MTTRIPAEMKDAPVQKRDVSPLYMERKPTVSKWVRAGVAALPVYGLLTGWATLTHQPNAQVDFPAYANYISTPEFFAHHLVGSIGGSILMLYGSMALSAYLADKRGAATARVALLASTAGTVLMTSLFGVAAFAAPALGHAYLAGNESMAAINQAIYSTPLGLTGVTGGLLYTLGTILFGIAIWRSGMLPKGAAVLYALAGPLLSLVGLFVGEAQTVGSIFWVVAGLWLLWRISFGRATETK